MTNSGQYKRCYDNKASLPNSKNVNSTSVHMQYCKHYICLHDCYCCSVDQLYLTLCDLLAAQASLSLTISPSLPKFMSIASVMPSSHFILWRPFLLLPPIFHQGLFQWVGCLHQKTKITKCLLDYWQPNGIPNWFWSCLKATYTSNIFTCSRISAQGKLSWESLPWSLG